MDARVFRSLSTSRALRQMTRTGGLEGWPTCRGDGARRGRRFRLHPSALGLWAGRTSLRRGRAGEVAARVSTGPWEGGHRSTRGPGGVR
jgi:hypothetical protein